MSVEIAKAELEAAGYTVVKSTTYRRLLRRIQVLGADLEFEKKNSAATTRWAKSAFDEQKRLAERLTFVYGEARAAGCSVEQLRGDGQ